MSIELEAMLGLEPDDAAMVKLHEQMNAALLEYERAQGIEMRDGDAAITVPFVAKMHELLEEAATLGDSDATAARQDVAETCHNASDAAGEGYFKCSACGASCSVEWESGGWGVPRFCPACGRRVVDE